MICICIDFTTHTATFICAVDSTASNHCSAANPPYCIDFQHNQIALHSIGKGTEPTPSKSVHWLQNTLLPKLRNWSTPVDDANDSQRTSIGTHRLLDSQEEYINLYNELKLKYGVDMVERWPEQTDAAKFVYEDVAIATYLLVLWRQERTATNTERLQSFVDLGCGNGLLVFILSSEGHRGYGIDLRKRGIWDMYPETTELKVTESGFCTNYVYKLPRNGNSSIRSKRSYRPTTVSIRTLTGSSATIPTSFPPGYQSLLHAARRPPATFCCRAVRSSSTATSSSVATPATASTTDS